MSTNAEPGIARRDKAETPQAGRTLKFPTAYTILFLLIIVVAARMNTAAKPCANLAWAWTAPPEWSPSC